MILLLLLVSAAVITLLVLLYAVRGQNARVGEVEDLTGHTRPVDLEAFGNLIDPREEQFLRDNLPRREFRAIQRERLLAAAEYIGNTAYNAALLLRWGEAAARNPDARIALAGQQLIDRALRVRLYALLCLAKLYVRLALPNVPASLSGLVENYQHLSGMATQLALMQQPMRASRLSAVL